MKIIESTKTLRPQILAALNKIADPVVQTLSPKGRNVLFEDHNGSIFVTNDGVTIAKQIESEDPVEDAIIRTVKYSSLQTNALAGDGTTTTTMFSRFLVREGYKMIDDGINEMDLKKILTDFSHRVVAKLKPIKVTDDAQLLSVASISANNDDAIAADVLQVVKTAGDTGLVFINPSLTGKTEVVKDTGYIVNTGILAKELLNDGINRSTYENVHVLITDKRLYYEEECEHIISTALENGIQNLVIVAKDFIGKAPNFLIGNHVNGVINLLLVKFPDDEGYGMSDLATFLGGRVVTEKSGMLVNKLKAEDLVLAQKVYATRERTVFQTMNQYSPVLTKLIDEVKEERDKDKDNKEVERRLSSLTSGIVTVNVGGATGIETQENIFRYEDAINATRAAMRDGYLPGGGLALFNATRDEELPIFKKLGEESIRQIARNCGKYEDYIISLSGGDTGYNAKTDKFENLLKAGVIDPYKVTEMAIVNSVSVAIAILTSGYLIVNKKEDNDK
jgi:chaperonin GroEL